MRKHISLPLMGILLLGASWPGHARDIYVLDGGAGAQDGSSWANALPTIGAGLQAAAPLDTVNVGTGTYYERITVPAGIRLVGGYLVSGGQAIWYPRTSILDGQNAGSVVTVAAGAGLDTRLAGFTIRNGTGTLRQGKRYGGGVFIENASPTLSQNLLTDNRADVGAGVYLGNSGASIYSNSFVSNTATDGGGVAAEGGSPRIQLSFFRSNFADRGGAVSVIGVPDSYIAGNIFEVNQARIAGGGVYVTRGRVYNNTILRGRGAEAVRIADGGTVWFVNNIVAFNTAGVLVGDGAAATVRNNDVFGNSGGNYQGITDPTGTAGNISVDPALTDLYAGDYIPVPGSPVVDAGDATVVGFGAEDHYRNPRIQGTSVDMGAAEWFEPIQNGVIRVKPATEGGNDANDGLSWNTSKATIQAAVAAAQAVYGEVWVAAGTYAQGVRIENLNVRLYGGFEGTETQRNQRNPETNVTILDGAGLLDSVVVIMGSSVAGQQITNATVVDGFTIRNGTARNGGSGGGIRIEGASPVISGNNIEDNLAPAGAGGGISVRGGSPYIAANSVRRNRAGRGGGMDVEASAARIGHNVLVDNAAVEPGGAPRQGGGLYIANTSGDPGAQVTGNVVRSNRARQGGGLYLASGFVLVRGNEIRDNKAEMGSVDSLGGGIFSQTGAAMLNNTIVANESAGSGGGIAVKAGPGATTNNVIANNIVVRNVAPLAGGVYATGADLNLSNNTLVANTAEAIHLAYPTGANTLSVSNNIVAFGVVGISGAVAPSVSLFTSYNIVYGNSTRNYDGISPSPTNITADPAMVDWAANDFHLRPESPGIDAGHNGIVSAEWRDMDGEPRALGGRVEIGADEYTGLVVTPGLRRTMEALRIAGGLDATEDGEMEALNVETSGASASRIDLLDAARIAGQAAGLD